MFEQSHDPAVVVDDTGRIVVANEAVERVLGHKADALTAEPVEVLVPSRFRSHELHRHVFFAEDRTRPMGHGPQLFAQHADGSEVPVDISLTSISADGKRFVIACLRDLRGRSFGVDTLKVQAKALYAAASGVVITNPFGIITWVNPAACAITGYTGEELVGQHTRLLKSGLHDDSFYEALWVRIRRGETWAGTMVNKRKDGTLYREEQTIAPVTDAQGAVTHFIAIKQDVTERLRLRDELERSDAERKALKGEIEALNNRLREQAVRDPLTLLYNRNYFEGAVERDEARMLREHAPLSFVVMDVDDFRFVNSEWGRASGDRVLQSVADVLRLQVRAADLACRLEADRFVVILCTADAAAALDRAEQWRLAFADAVTVSSAGTDIRCTASFGVAQHDAARESVYDALRRAEGALAAAKRAGRNCARIAD